MPASRYYANRLGSRALAVVSRRPAPRYAVRVPGRAAERAAGLPPARPRLRDRNRDAGQAVAARRAYASVPITAVYAGQSASCGRCATPRRRVSLRSTTDTSSDSDVRLQPPPVPAPPDEAPAAAPALPRRWTLHGLNNGTIFRATVHGVQRLPRPVSYAIGHVGTWLAWRTDAETRRAVADNLAAVFPDECRAGARAPGARTRCGATPRDTSISCARCPAAPRGGRHCSTSTRSIRDDVPAAARRAAAASLLVTGHYGNWEIGSLLIRACSCSCRSPSSRWPKPIPQVNRIRHELRAQLGADDARSPPVARHRAADPPPSRRQPDRRDADRSPLRPRPRAGHAVRTAGLVPADAAADGACHRRAAGALLHRADRPWTLQAEPRTRSTCGAICRVRKPSRPRRSRSPMRSPSGSDGAPSSGITSTATGTPSATLTTGWADGKPGVKGEGRRDQGESLFPFPLTT